MSRPALAVAAPPAAVQPEFARGGSNTSTSTEARRELGGGLHAAVAEPELAPALSFVASLAGIATTGAAAAGSNGRLQWYGNAELLPSPPSTV